MPEIAFTTAGRNAAWDSSGTGLNFSVAYFRLYANDLTPDGDTVVGDLGDRRYPTGDTYADISSTQISDSQREFRIHLDSSVGSTAFTFRSVGLFLNDGTNGAADTLFAVIVLDDDFTKSTDNEFRLNIPMQFGGDLDPLEIVNVIDSTPTRIVEVANLEGLGAASSAASRETTASENFAFEFTLPDPLPDDGIVVATLSPRPASSIVVRQATSASASVTSGDTALTESSSGTAKGLVIVGNQVKIATSGTRYGAGTIAVDREIRIEYDSQAVNTPNTYLVQDLNTIAHVSTDGDQDLWEFTGYHYVGDVAITGVDGGTPPANVEVARNTINPLLSFSYADYSSGDLIVQTKTDATGSNLVLGLAKSISGIAPKSGAATTIVLTFADSGGPTHNMAEDDTLAVYVRSNQFNLPAAPVRDEIEIDELNLLTGKNVVPRYPTLSQLKDASVLVRSWATFGDDRSTTATGVVGGNTSYGAFIYNSYNVSSLFDQGIGRFRIKYEKDPGGSNDIFCRLVSGSCNITSGANTSVNTGYTEDDSQDNASTLALFRNLDGTLSDPQFACTAAFWSSSGHKPQAFDDDIIVNPILPNVAVDQRNRLSDNSPTDVASNGYTEIAVRLKASSNTTVHVRVNSGDTDNIRIGATDTTTTLPGTSASPDLVFTTGNYYTWQVVRLFAVGQTDNNFFRRTAIIEFSTDSNFGTIHKTIKAFLRPPGWMDYVT